MLLLAHAALLQALPTLHYQVNRGIVSANVPTTTRPVQTTTVAPPTTNAGGKKPTITSHRKARRDPDYLPPDLKRAMMEFQDIPPNSALPGFA
ncbi:hypothetical protein IWQ61_010366, partial [Dispira simplex]